MPRRRTWYWIRMTPLNHPFAFVMGASIAEPRSDERIGKSRRGLMPGRSDLRADRQALADELRLPRIGGHLC